MIVPRRSGREEHRIRGKIWSRVSRELITKLFGKNKMQAYGGMVNVFTGKRYIIDNKKKRLERMKSRVVAWSKLQPAGGWYCMITLTYDTLKTKYELGKDYEERDITEFIKRLKGLLLRRGVSILGYAWTVELQPSGHVHYHVLLNLDKKIFRFYPDKLGLWKWGDSSFTPANTVGYIVKYASKGVEQVTGEYPPGLRIFAVWIADKFIKKYLVWLFEPLWKKRGRMAGFYDDELKEFGSPDTGWRFVGASDNLGYLDSIMDTALASYDSARC
jgi:hypothetical protein